MRNARSIAALTLSMAIFSSLGLSSQERRIALVIGNGAYRYNATLRNPPNDAQDMAAALRKRGFAVTSLVNAGRADMEKAVRDFGNALKDPGAVGLFFFSGHGAQAEGQNYILPVDADIQDVDELRYKAMDAESVLAKMRSAGNRLNIVILDACRNNPFPGSTRSADRGLAVVKVKVPESLIVYATDPGSVAADGEGRNSPFSAAFMAAMEEPGLDVTVMMKRVTARVQAATGGAQTPWISSNLSRDFAFTAGAAKPAPAAASVPAAAAPSSAPAPAAAPAASPAPAFFKFLVNANVAGAKLFIDNRLAGVVGTPVMLPPGKFMFAVKADGYYDYIQVVEMNGDKTITAMLMPKPAGGN